LKNFVGGSDEGNSDEGDVDSEVVSDDVVSDAKWVCLVETLVPSINSPSGNRNNLKILLTESSRLCCDGAGKNFQQEDPFNGVL